MYNNTYMNIKSYELLIKTANSAIDDIMAELDYNAVGALTDVRRFEWDDTDELYNLIAQSQYQYNARNQITSINHQDSNNNNIVSHGYLYNADGNISQYTNSIDGSVLYDYDFLGQLTGANYSNLNIPDESYQYDLNGNRELVTNANGDLVVYSTGLNNELNSDGNYFYTYDAEGNRISKTNAAGTERELYDWDYRNRLSSVTKQEYNTTTQEWEDVQIVEYAYDYNNVLIRKVLDANGDGTADSKTLFLPENYQTAIQLDDADLSDSTYETVSHRYLWTPGQQDKLLADIQVSPTGSETLWTLTDHLGTIRDVVKNTPSGLVVPAHIIYDAYGNVLSCKDANGTDIESPVLFGFTGKFFDDSTGLQNNINRWYDNTTGKWLSVDPIGFYGGTPNLYQYVGNQPICDWDQLGLAEYREKFIDKLKEKIGDNVDIDFSKWEVHHIIPQRLKDIGGIGNLDSLDNLVLIPKEVHYQITAIQNSEFVDWTNKKDTILKKLSNNNEKQLKIDKEINKIIYENYLPIMNDNIEDVFGKYMIRIDDDVKTIIAKIDNVNKANKNIKEFKAMLEHKRFIALQQIQKYFPRMLIGLSVFVTYEQAKEIANPSPQTEKALENLISVYRGALYENCKYHHVRSDTWGKIGTYLDQYLAAIQADAKLRMFLQYEILKKENGM